MCVFINYDDHKGTKYSNDIQSIHLIKWIECRSNSLAIIRRLSTNGISISTILRGCVLHLNTYLVCSITRRQQYWMVLNHWKSLYTWTKRIIRYQFILNCTTLAQDNENIGNKTSHWVKLKFSNDFQLGETKMVQMSSLAWDLIPREHIDALGMCISCDKCSNIIVDNSRI